MAQMPRPPAAGRLHSVFRRACTFQFESDYLLALVAPEVGNGPLNVVLERMPVGWQHLQPGTAVRFEDKRVRVDGVNVYLDGASIWEPCPDWERLRADATPILRRAELLADWVQERAPGGSMPALLNEPSRDDGPTGSVVHARALAGAESMWAGWQGNESQVRAGTAQLAGLGGGLTPAGDDFLLGAMLCAWLAHPDPVWYCRLVVEEAASRTTMLSAAFLRATASGECGAVWHRLLETLGGDSEERLTATAAAVLSYGHTSGADALAGFLWMGQRVLGGSSRA
ncbi:MAG: DUF2877 domain-containing protein [Anaerolineae bacterium]